MIKNKVKRKDIIQAGYNLMYLRGYNAVAIKDITDSVGIPKGSFYNHFPSKEAFALEVLEYYQEHFEKQMNHRLSDRVHSPISRLKEYFSGMIINFEKKYKYSLGCLAANFAQELADENPNFRKASDQALERFINSIEQCLGEAQSTGQIEPIPKARELAEFLFNSWEGALIKMKAQKSTAPLKTFYRITFEHILK
jgi:TetR/AcrR family transcriptional repressor of nem operon